MEYKKKIFSIKTINELLFHFLLPPWIFYTGFLLIWTVLLFYSNYSLKDSQTNEVFFVTIKDSNKVLSPFISWLFTVLFFVFNAVISFFYDKKSYFLRTILLVVTGLFVLQMVYFTFDVIKDFARQAKL
jgi:hypothetical protein